MHLLEVALFAQFDAFDHKRREPDEPMPEQWPRPRLSRTAIAVRAISDNRDRGGCGWDRGCGLGANLPLAGEITPPRLWPCLASIRTA